MIRCHSVSSTSGAGLVGAEVGVVVKAVVGAVCVLLLPLRL